MPNPPDVLLIAALNVAIACTALAGETNSAASAAIQFPSRVGTHPIALEVRAAVNKFPTIEAQTEYLAGILTNQPAPTDVGNSQKVSAIRLLGYAGKTNSTDLLLSQIAFRDINGHSYPAVYALAHLGEAAVPKLLDLVDESTNQIAIANAVQTLVLIKGTNYETFVLRQKDNVRPDTWNKLIRHALNE